MSAGWKAEDVDLTFVRQVARFLDATPGAGRPEPFFLYLALSAPHNPWLPPDFVKGKSAEGPRGDMNVLVDWCVGQVRAALEERGLLDRTLLIFASDHGPMPGQNGQRSAGMLRGFKNTAFEGGHRIPFVARWPSGIPAGTVSSQLLCHTDLVATFAALTGCSLPADAAEDSHNMLPAFLGRGIGDPGRAALVTDTGRQGPAGGDVAVRAGKWKLIIMAPRDDDPPGWVPMRYLFDLQSDPGEQDNLIDQRPSVAREIEHLLGKLRARGSRWVRA
jgi:arylsulfatase A